MDAMRAVVKKSDTYDPDLFLRQFMARGGQLTDRLLDIGGERLKIMDAADIKRNFAITTSGVNWNPALQLCIEVLGAAKIMWAVDYPYQETMEAARWMNEAPVSDADKEKIFHGNAERIFRIAPGATGGQP
jgi:predicted TIM-barrel fold metal-dependent hydrolase